RPDHRRPVGGCGHAAGAPSLRWPGGRGRALRPRARRRRDRRAGGGARVTLRPGSRREKSIRRGGPTQTTGVDRSHRHLLTRGPFFLLLAVSACVGSIPGGGSGDEGAPGGGAGGSPPRSGGGGPRPPGMTVPPPRDRPPAAAVATTRFARLSHRQWENSVRDLLRLPAVPGLSAKFSTDAAGTFTSGEVLSVSDNLRADYQTAAEVVAQKVAQDPAALARIAAPGSGKDRIVAFIRDFGLRAYRRPLDDQENTAFLALFQQGATLVPGVDPFAAGVQLTIEAMLQSPHFLYRTELGGGAGRQRLGPYEIAAKLSYALVGTMPDDALFMAAGGGALANDDQVVAQAERLLGKGGDPAVTFHDELFRLDGLTSDIEKDATRFPEFKPTWRDSIRKES